MELFPFRRLGMPDNAGLKCHHLPLSWSRYSWRSICIRFRDISETFLFHGESLAKRDFLESAIRIKNMSESTRLVADIQGNGG